MTPAESHLVPEFFIIPIQDPPFLPRMDLEGAVLIVKGRQIARTVAENLQHRIRSWPFDSLPKTDLISVKAETIYQYDETTVEEIRERIREYEELCAQLSDDEIHKNRLLRAHRDAVRILDSLRAELEAPSTDDREQSLFDRLASSHEPQILSGDELAQMRAYLKTPLPLPALQADPAERERRQRLKEIVAYNDELRAKEVRGDSPTTDAKLVTEERKATAPDDLVTLDQAAAVVGRSKRSLELYLQRGDLPRPDLPGGGGKANRWYWGTLRPALQKHFRPDLPVKFPASRVI